MICDKFISSLVQRKAIFNNGSNNRPISIQFISENRRVSRLHQFRVTDVMADVVAAVETVGLIPVQVCLVCLSVCTYLSEEEGVTLKLPGGHSD